MITTSTFKPAMGLSNPDIQSLFPTVARHRLNIATVPECLELPDGDFLDLEWVGEGDGPIVILLHGMAGSRDSPYIKGIMQEIIKRGWRGVLMCFRGCSGRPNRLASTYHLAQTEDLRYVVEHLQYVYRGVTLYAVGYSMGGNILLKWLGENPDQMAIATAVAVSAPYDLRAASQAARNGKGRFYQWVLLKDLRRYVTQKYQYPNAPFDIKKLDSIKSFWELDEQLTAPINGFSSATDYYRQASCKRVLNQVGTPTLILHAIDDPLVPASTIPKDSDLSELITLELSEYGGHIGFVAGTLRNPVFWLDGRVMDHFENFRKLKPSEFEQAQPENAYVTHDGGEII